MCDLEDLRAEEVLAAMNADERGDGHGDAVVGTGSNNGSGHKASRQHASDNPPGLLKRAFFERAVASKDPLAFGNKVLLYHDDSASTADVDQESLAQAIPWLSLIEISPFCEDLVAGGPNFYPPFLSSDEALVTVNGHPSAVAPDDSTSPAVCGTANASGLPAPSSVTHLAGMKNDPEVALCHTNSAASYLAPAEAHKTSYAAASGSIPAIPTFALSDALYFPAQSSSPTASSDWPVAGQRVIESPNALPESIANFGPIEQQVDHANPPGAPTSIVPDQKIVKRQKKEQPTEKKQTMKSSDKTVRRVYEWYACAAPSCSTQCRGKVGVANHQRLKHPKWHSEQVALMKDQLKNGTCAGTQSVADGDVVDVMEPMYE
ncbi:hypothetical protein BD626DRAFT_627490 [Schizophyllum amplum]|uniref:C2H2-type domain-containing protein n=1 Tax=Schizophyllum amplum TaxID=97359 RepID=A0A550CQI7_9AGAR|nr:hypothetical protein BD626DRAFT_627490 [Auriculariopsis ampla]